MSSFGPTVLLRGFMAFPDGDAKVCVCVCVCVCGHMRSSYNVQQEHNVLCMAYRLPHCRSGTGHFFLLDLCLHISFIGNNMGTRACSLADRIFWVINNYRFLEVTCRPYAIEKCVLHIFQVVHLGISSRSMVAPPFIMSVISRT